MAAVAIAFVAEALVALRLPAFAALALALVWADIDAARTRRVGRLARTAVA
jgi:hypothetical protein